MTKTIEVLIAYDIEDNKKRNRLFTYLKDVGMISIQKSVMWGRLLPADINLAKRILAKELDLQKDKAFIHISNISEKALFFGFKPEFEEYDSYGVF